MKTFQRFVLYKPENSGLPDYALFLQSTDGIDWYDAQKQFSQNTLKLAYDESGIICSAGVDATGMWPVNCSVAELDSKKIPAGFSTNGQWQFADGKVSKIPVDEVAIAKEQKTMLLEKAASEIAPLQDAIELDMGTEAEKTALTAWKTYRVLLNRVDTDSAPQIDWPEVPGVA